MSPKGTNPTLKVRVCRRIIAADGLFFSAEREIELPMAPFVGLQLFNLVSEPPGCEESDDSIEAVGFDLHTRQIRCYLELDDYRAAASGSDDWTVEDVKDRYRDWTLKQEEPGGESSVSGRNGSH
jgi:hypothetical protein